MTSSINLQSVTTWRKSSRSATNGNCVEVACPHEAVVAIRDSKLPTEGDFPRLVLDGDSWSGLIAGIKSGDIS